MTTFFFSVNILPMANFGTKSNNQLRTLDGRLQRLLIKAIKVIDFSILEGHRSKSRQQELYDQGKTKTLNSKHLRYPSLAVDIAPYPYPEDENGIRQLYMLIGIIRGLALSMDINIRSGSDWNNNFDIRDDNFQDAFHLEVIE